MTDEINSAEQAAENILKDAFAEVQAEECPQGTECPVHFRVGEEYIEEDRKYARLITYVGDYAVITEDNPALESPMIMLQILLGRISKEDLPPRWATMVFKVDDGVIGDLSHRPAEAKREALRYSQTSDDWEGLTAQHNAIVATVEAGLIDLSKPFKLEG